MSKPSILKEKIKISHFWAIFTVAVFLIPPMAARAQTVSLSPSSTTVGQNQQFNVDVNVSGASDLFTIGFDLLFDPALLQFVSASDGGFLSQNGVATLLLANENPRGDLVFSNARLGAYNGGVTGAGTSAHLTFRSLAQDGRTALAFSGGSLCVLVNGSCSYVSGSWNNGSVAISTPDTAPPTAPTGLRAVSVTTDRVDLAWDASTDNVGVTGYRVYRDNVYMMTVTGTNYYNAGLAPGESHSYRISAMDAAANESAQSTSLAVTMPLPPDTAAPAITINSPTSDATYVTSLGSLNLAGTASDNAGVRQVSWINGRGGSGVAAGATNWTINNIALQPGDNLITVAARDAVGNVGYDSVTVAYNPPDTTAPNVPAGLAAAAVSSSEIDLSWNASADDRGGAVSYKIYRAGVYLTAVNTTSFQNIGLAPATGYSYQVSAVDTAGNESARSSAVTATTPVLADTTPPSAPVLAASAVSPTQINMAWSASTDPAAAGQAVSGVAGYRLYRDSILIATVTGTSYQNWNLLPQTSYTYKVVAFDAAGNNSADSNPVTVATPAAADIAAPSVPTGLAVTSVTVERINLAWNPSSDDVGVSGYRVYRDDVYMMTVAGPAYYNAGLAPGESHSYQVSAIDQTGNESARSSAVTATTRTLSDITPPTAPSNLRGTVFNYQVNLTWYGSLDNVAVAGYKIYRNNAPVGSTNQTSYNDRSLEPGKIYVYNVSAVDQAGNESARSNSLQLSVLTGTDRVKPSTPGGFKKKNVTGSEIQFYWPASTDNVGVAGYRIFRNNQYLTTVSQAEFNDAGLKYSTNFTYRVSAVDGSGNESYLSWPASFTTLLPPDTFAPSAPTGLRVNYNLYYYPRDVRLYWYGSRDDRPGRLYYNVYRDGAFIGSTTGTSFYNKLSDYGVYQYHVRAVDTAGNQSAPSNSVSVNYAPDTTPPPAPTGLRVNYNLYYYPRDVRLYWYGSRDERPGRVYYDVYRDGSLVGSTTGTSFLNKLSDYGVYDYQVRAVDVAGNESAPSNTVSVNYAPDTTPPPAPAGFRVYQDWRDKSVVRAYWYGVRDERPGAVRYNVYRNGSMITTTSWTSFSERLAAKGSFSYSVAALDAAGNESARSAAITVSW